MTSTATATSPRPAAMLVPRAALVIGACVALAGLSLLRRSSPSYDPYAWIVWGRELVDHGQTFSMEGGPSWKPLPVLFTTLFAFAGGAAAPALWLLVARAGGLLALAGAFALGRRLAGVRAGVLAAAGLALTDGFLSLGLRGASEPLLVACVLWAVELHVAGRRGSAFALSVAATLIRPEALPFLVLYALWRWRGAAARERALIAGGLALVPLLWVGLPGLAGEPFAASSHAAQYDGHTGSDPGWTALRRGLALAVAPVWVLALPAVALRPHDRLVRALALGSGAWLLLVVTMTIAGFPGLARFMLPAAAGACVLAGTGLVVLVEHAGGGARAVAVAALLLAACAALSIARAGTFERQLREEQGVAKLQHELSQAVAALGGRAGVLRCATGGTVATNHTAQTALAWKLHVELTRVSPQVTRPALVFQGPQSEAIGEPPPVTLPEPWHTTVLGRVGHWKLLVVEPRGVVVPRACRLAS